jgi:uncharacterized surface protein with fasciclin (FAS1) repeats
MIASVLMNLRMEINEMQKLKQLIGGFFLVAMTTMGINAANAETTKGTVDKFLAEDVRLTTLWKAIQTAGLEEAFKGAGPFTIFAPDNAAFEHLGRGTFDDLVKDKEKLAKVLKYHVIPGEKIVLSDKTKGKQTVKTLEGQNVALTKPKKKRFFVNKAQVVEKDEIMADNGVVHIIDHVLLPPTGI